MQLAENTGRKKSPKIRHLGTHHYTTLSICIFATKVCIDILHMSPQCGELGPLTDEIGLLVWGSDIAHRRPTSCEVFSVETVNIFSSLNKNDANTIW